MKHQSLITLELLVEKFLRDMTNQAYSRNMKFSYRMSWEKGTGEILDDNNKTIKQYYSFTYYLVDKTDSPVGNKVELYNNYYPIVFGTSVDQLHEQALSDFLLNGAQSLTNIFYSLYLERQKKQIVKVSEVKLDENVEAVKESAKLPALDLKPVPRLKL